MSASQRSRFPWRSIGAVFAGILTNVILSLGTDVILHATGIFPGWGEPMSDSLFLLATVYRTLYTVLGGYVTAQLAPDRPLRHAVILGVIGIVLATAGTVATWEKGPEFGPKWYPLLLIITALPCSWLGGKLRVKQESASF